MSTALCSCGAGLSQEPEKHLPPCGLATREAKAEFKDEQEEHAKALAEREREELKSRKARLVAIRAERERAEKASGVKLTAAERKEIEAREEEQVEREAKEAAALQQAAAQATLDEAARQRMGRIPPFG